MQRSAGTFRRFLTTLLVAVQAALGAGAFAQELTITPSFAATKSIAADEAFELRLSRPMQPGDGLLSVFIGRSDVTSLFAASGAVLKYRPDVLPLQPGDTTVSLFLVSSTNEWREIARFDVRISPAGSAEPTAAPSASPPANAPPQPPTPATPRKVSAVPSVTLGVKSQPAESHEPDSRRPERPTFTDFVLQSSFQSNVARGDFAGQSRFDVVGSSFEKEALRFAQLGADAPEVDLSSYLVQMQAGKARIQIGQLAIGTNRHLVNNFASRGVSVLLPLGHRADVTVAAANGTTIVGWDNFIGVQRAQHRMASGTLGVEFLPARPGGARVEATVLDGSLLPVANFNRGSITDAEQNRALGVRFITTDPNRRFRVDTGFSRSKFTNPTDPLLNQGVSVVPVAETMKNARYLEAGVGILKDRSLTKTRKANLTLNYRHERADPLYRSIGAPQVQSDLQQNQWDLVSALGDVTANAVFLQSNNNLRDIPSILKSVTHRSGMTLAVPLASLFGNPATPSLWLPRATYVFDLVHQFGVGQPVNGGFEVDRSTIPDQATTNQNLLAEWQVRLMRFGYRFNRSYQDNRQPGRERADFRNLINGAIVGIATRPADLNVELNAERALNFETGRLDQTVRVGLIGNWRMTAAAALAVNVAGTAVGDAANTSRNTNGTVDALWSWTIPIRTSGVAKVRAQFFVRFANVSTRSRDIVFGFNTLATNRTFNTGLTFTFF
jgi:hypothetical protein